MDKQEEPKDPQLDIPAVANEGKHISFIAEEEKTVGLPDDGEGPVNADEARSVQERREQWEKGIEAGKQDRAKTAD